jgi:hypothetical protein
MTFLVSKQPSRGRQAWNNSPESPGAAMRSQGGAAGTVAAPDFCTVRVVEVDDGEDMVNDRLVIEMQQPTRGEAVE